MLSDFVLVLIRIPQVTLNDCFTTACHRNIDVPIGPVLYPFHVSFILSVTLQYLSSLTSFPTSFNTKCQRSHESKSHFYYFCCCQYKWLRNYNIYFNPSRKIYIFGIEIGRLHVGLKKKKKSEIPRDIQHYYCNIILLWSSQEYLPVELQDKNPALMILHGS